MDPPRGIFGNPMLADGVTLVPAAIVTPEGHGRPAGVFVVCNGDVHWRPAVNVNRAILGGQVVGATALLVCGAVALAWIVRQSAAKPAP